MLNQQITTPTYIPQTNLVLTCYDETNRIDWHYENQSHIQLSLSELSEKLQQLVPIINKPSLRVQIRFHAQSVNCYRNLRRTLNVLNNQTNLKRNLPFIITSFHVIQSK